jgi:3,4-dihydroxy 2-butanone 4-phosphate synthase/GTP cyclohydrolase II
MAREQELLVRRVADSIVHPRAGGVRAPFRACVYTTDVEDTEYLALVLGDIRPDVPTLVRVQTANVLRDVFSAADDPSLGASLRMIEEAGVGVFLYVFPRARASLVGELSGAPATPTPPSAGTEPRLRAFGLGAQVLAHLGVGRIRLLTNHPKPIVGVAGYGLHIDECLPIAAPAKVVALPREREG